MHGTQDLDGHCEQQFIQGTAAKAGRLNTRAWPSVAFISFVCINGTVASQRSTERPEPMSSIVSILLSRFTVSATNRLACLGTRRPSLSICFPRFSTRAPAARFLGCLRPFSSYWSDEPSAAVLALTESTKYAQ